MREREGSRCLEDIPMAAAGAKGGAPLSSSDCAIGPMPNAPFTLQNLASINSLLARFKKNLFSVHRGGLEAKRKHDRCSTSKA